MNVNNIISKQKSYEIIKSRDGTFLSELVKNSFIVYCVRSCKVNKLSTIFRESFLTKIGKLENCSFKELC